MPCTPADAVAAMPPTAFALAATSIVPLLVRVAEPGVLVAARPIAALLVGEVDPLPDVAAATD
jgi:hypothetical protein